MRLIVIFVVMAVVLSIPFLIWGDQLFSAAADGPRAAQWLRGFGPWAWLAAMGLLASDLLLPIPGSTIMTALGIIYGPVLGGTIGAIGHFVAGISGYLATRMMGRKVAVFLAGERDLVRGERLFARLGGFAVALSRSLPVVAEAITCMAGLTRMPAGRFCAAMVCGTIPMTFAFAYIGHANADRPLLALGIACVAAPLMWLAAWLIIRKV